MAGGGNPFAGTRLGGPGPTPRPRPTAGSSRRPTHPPASQKPKTPQSVSHLFDEDDTEDDPFAGYKPKGRGSMQATLDAVGLNDAVDPEDPFGIGNKPLAVGRQGNASGNPDFDLFAVANDFGAQSPGSGAGGSTADRRSNSWSGSTPPRPKIPGSGATAQNSRRARPKPPAVAKSGGGGAGMVEEAQRERVKSPLRQSGGGAPAATASASGTTSPARRHSGADLFRPPSAEPGSPRDMFKPPDDHFRETLMMRDWFDDDGGVGDELGAVESENPPILGMLKAKLDAGLITDAEYDKCCLDHLVTNKLSPLQDMDDWNADAPTDGRGLTAEQRRIFEMPEKERLRVMHCIKSGVITYEEALACIEQGQPVMARETERSSKEIRDAAVLSAGDPNTLPTWMTRRLACAELASLVETEAAAKARLLAVEARLDEVERALDVAETAKVLAESRMAKAEAESAIKGRAHLESEAQLTKVQNKLIALRQRCSKLEFEAESMQIRNADLQGKLKQAEVERFEARSMVEVMGYIKDVADKSGIDLRDLSAAGREEKVRLILHRLASSEVARTVDQALGGPEVTEILNGTMTRLGKGDAPLEVIGELLTSGDLATVLNALSRDGLLGAKGRSLSQTGHIDRFCERMGVAFEHEKLIDLIQIGVTALGSPNPHLEFLQIIRDPVTHAKVHAAAAEGLLGPAVQEMAESGSLVTGMERIAGAVGADAVRSVFARARALGQDGSLLLVTQFAGDETPLGQAAQKMNTIVNDGTLDWLEELVCSRVEGFLGADSGAGESTATEGTPVQAEGDPAPPLAAASVAGNPDPAQGGTAVGRAEATAATAAVSDAAGTTAAAAPAAPIEGGDEGGSQVDPAATALANPSQPELTSGTGGGAVQAGPAHSETDGVAEGLDSAGVGGGVEAEPEAAAEPGARKGSEGETTTVASPPDVLLIPDVFGFD